MEEKENILIVKRNVLGLIVVVMVVVVVVINDGSGSFVVVEW